MKWGPGVFMTLLLGVVHAGAAPAAIVSLDVSPAVVDRYARVDVTFELGKTYTNPYDPDIIDASVVFTTANRVTRTIPAFWIDPPSEPARWEARLCADWPGVTRLRVVARDADGRRVSAERTFETRDEGGQGFVRVDSRNPRYLRFDRGEPYLPVGHNVAWGNADYYRRIFSKMSAVGENWSRIWICAYKGYGLEWNAQESDYEGVGRYSQSRADHFDQVMEEAREMGIYVQIAMDSFNGWNYTVYSNGLANPYLTTNGGWLETLDQYFTDPLAFEYAKKKHRYIVARWAYNPNVLCWEFFNEVNITHNFWNQRPAVLDWHQRQAQYIQSIDPYDHLITTSFSNNDEPGVRAPEFWEIPEHDLVQTHRYNNDLPGAHVSLVRDAQRFGKPVIHGEFGVGKGPGNIHDAIWGLAMTESAAMSWYWRNIEPDNLYGVFQPLTTFLQNEDWADKGLEQTGYRVTSGHQLDLYGVRGPKRAYLWIDAPGTDTVTDLGVEISGVQNGSYYAQYWDTYAGSVLETQLELASGGQVHLEIPAFQKDIAAKVFPVAAEPTATPTLTPSPVPTETPRPGDLIHDG